MFHTVAYRASISDVTATDVTPVTDGIMLIQNGHFVPQRDLLMPFASYQAAGATRARIVTPSLRGVTTPWIKPSALAIVQGAEPHVADYRANPLILKALEEIEFEAFQTTGGAAVVVGILGLMVGGIVPAPQGTIYTMRGTGTTTLTAGAWTVAAITWQDTLPAGLYACLGLWYVGATALAARLIFEDSNLRPGCVATGLATSRQHPMFQLGGLGIWGQFNANRMPNIECLANAADTAQEVFLDFVRIG